MFIVAVATVTEMEPNDIDKWRKLVTAENRETATGGGERVGVEERGNYN